MHLHQSDPEFIDHIFFQKLQHTQKVSQTEAQRLESHSRSPGPKVVRRRINEEPKMIDYSKVFQPCDSSYRRCSPLTALLPTDHNREQSYYRPNTEASESGFKLTPKYRGQGKMASHFRDKSKCYRLFRKPQRQQDISEPLNRSKKRAQYNDQSHKVTGRREEVGVRSKNREIVKVGLAELTGQKVQNQEKTRKSKVVVLTGELELSPWSDGDGSCGEYRQQHL